MMLQMRHKIIEHSHIFGRIDLGVILFISWSEFVHIRMCYSYCSAGLAR